MQAFNMPRELPPGHENDVPPPPIRYTEYVERKLYEYADAAYQRGFDRGCRRQLLVLLIGMVFGWILGFRMG